jgi:dipeptidase E
MTLLLLSNSTNYGGGYLDHAMTAIRELLAGVRSLVFVPFALHDPDAYTARVRARFAREGIAVRGVGLEEGPQAVEGAEAVFVGGGNTFRLLLGLQECDLVHALRERVLAGMPYLGASAGTNVAAPTIMTTNDMPIVEPLGFDALHLVPFQINPHYIDADPASVHMGETREQRLLEYLEENPWPVVGLREGGWLRVEGSSVRLESASARLFRRGRDPEDVQPPAELGRLLAG